MKSLKFTVLLWVLACRVFLGTTQCALAQEYSFSVPELELQVIVIPDASVRLIYDITFENSPRGKVIDMVDIGMPHSDYAIGNMKASVDGVILKDIRPSEYVNPGVEIHLKRQSIQSGRAGILHFEATVPNLVYQDTTRDDYASLRITPTWFDSRFVQGLSSVKVAVQMLPGIRPEELLYQNVRFSSKALWGNSAVAVWSDQRPATGAYLVGVSFPKRGLLRVVKMSRFELLSKWLTDHPGIWFWCSLLVVALFSFLFFRFSGGTGFSVYFVLLLILFVLCIAIPAVPLVGIVPLAILIYFNERSLKKRRKRKCYLPAIASLEAGGIKRGLTAPEAAVLLELPLSKVLTLVIFGMIKKGILRTVDPSPLTVEVNEAFGEALKGDKKKMTKRLREQAGQKGIAFHEYEQPFLEEIIDHPHKPLKEMDFTRALDALISRVVKKMEHFDLKGSREYYRGYIARTLKMVKDMEEVEVQQKLADWQVDWLMMDDHFPEVLPRTYAPRWFHSSHESPVSSVSGSAPRAPAVGGTTSLSDVAASFAGWTEGVMGSMANAIAPANFSTAVSGGFIDLSGVDRATGQFFDALAASSGGGGGGGGCACAGCACACACAGGGR